MTNTPWPQDMHAANYMGVLRRRWWLVVAAAVIGTLGALGYYKVAHKYYTATALVNVTATAGTTNQAAGSRTSGAVNLDTQAQVVLSVAVGQAAAKMMHATDSVPLLISRTTVTVPPNSQVLSISCKAGTPAGAAACAQAFAQSYLNYTSATTRATLSAQISDLQSRISTLQANSAKADVEVASLPSNSAQRAAAEEQLSSDHSQLGSLNSQVAQLTAQLANPSGGSIISSATAPTHASDPKALIVIPSGLLVGLLVGLVLAFIVDRRDRRVREPRDITQLDVPVLMSLPLKRFTPELAIATPRSVAGREFAELAHVVAATLGAGNHVIVVAGPADSQGVGLVAANLAVALSRNQPDVTLVCADLERSVIPDMLGLPPSAPGLIDLLDDHPPTSNAGRRLAAAPRLRVISPGSAGGNDVPDLQQDAVDHLLANLREASRWVVIEAPPVTSGPDIYTLAHAADAAVLVAEARRTRSDRLLEAVQHLEKMGTAVLGAVLVPSPKATAGSKAQALSPGRNGQLEQPAGYRAPASGSVSGWPASDETPTSMRGS